MFRQSNDGTASSIQTELRAGKHPFLNGWLSHGTRLSVLLVLALIAILVLASSGNSHGEPTGHKSSTGALPDLETRGKAQAFCIPLDFGCYLKEITDTLVKNAFETARPVLDAIQQNDFNIVTQTPGKLTYGHEEGVAKVANWAVTVVDVALICIIGLAGYHVMMGRALGLSTSEVMVLLPRIALAVVAAHLWQFITALVIDLNNALCLGVSDLLALTWLQDNLKIAITRLTNPMMGIGQQGLFIILSIWMVCLLLLLFWQMLVRLSLVILCVALAPLGLFALALPMTQSFGQVWVSIFLHTVLIQFFQVAALALAGLLMLAITQGDLGNFPRDLVSLFAGATMLFLVQKLPGMLREYALRPILQAGEQSGNAVVGVITRVAATI